MTYMLDKTKGNLLFYRRLGDYALTKLTSDLKGHPLFERERPFRGAHSFIIRGSGIMPALDVIIEPPSHGVVHARAITEFDLPMIHNADYRFVIYSLLRDKCIIQRSSPPMAIQLIPSTDVEEMRNRASRVAEALNRVVSEYQRSNPGVQILFDAKPILDILDGLERLWRDENQPNTRVIASGIRALGKIKKEIESAVDAFGPWLRDALDLIPDYIIFHPVKSK